MSIKIRSSRGGSQKKQKPTNNISKTQKNEKLWEIEDILDEKVIDGKKYYRVKWKGFNSRYNTWEPSTNIYGEANESKKDGKQSKSKIIDELKKNQETINNNEEENWEVEDIINEKTENGKKYYEVKWKGFDSKYNTWVPSGNFQAGINKLKQMLSESAKAKQKLKKSLKPTKKPQKNPKTSPAKESESAPEKTWEIEEILDEKVKNGITYYYVKWKDFSSQYNTWEPLSNFIGGIETIKKATPEKQKHKQEILRKKIQKKKKDNKPMMLRHRKLL